MYMHFQARIFRCFTVFANLRLLVVHYVVKTVSFDRIKALRFMFFVTFSWFFWRFLIFEKYHKNLNEDMIVSNYKLKDSKSKHCIVYVPRIFSWCNSIIRYRQVGCVTLWLYTHAKYSSSINMILNYELRILMLSSKAFTSNHSSCCRMWWISRKLSGLRFIPRFL